MGRLSVALAALVALAMAAPSRAAAPLISNGRFTDGAGGVPTGWRLEAWAKDLSDVTMEPAADGQGVARLVNRGPNDARLCQAMPITPGGSYRVTARVRTENVGMATAGALIAIEPRIADSTDVKGTSDWQTLEVTAENTDATTWDVCLRLGSYANLNTGTAWFTDVKVEQVGGPAPAGDGATASRLPRFNVAPIAAAMRNAGWAPTAVPLVGGCLLAFGLGVIGRRRRD